MRHGGQSILFSVLREEPSFNATNGCLTFPGGTCIILLLNIWTPIVQYLYFQTLRSTPQLLPVRINFLKSQEAFWCSFKALLWALIRLLSALSSAASGGRGDTQSERLDWEITLHHLDFLRSQMELNLIRKDWLDWLEATDGERVLSSSFPRQHHFLINS